ncbi:transcription termination factor MTEF1, chloroplastic [Physcomitrium patens]|uniref:Uncharacterized protein n=1 Tax=Physcomitrium patens TaxID=3218 RepID=A0A2K1J9A0_PHYPA|nr:transcription termination factor MTEF1, chloroplastic-like [Physcomitrium patens]PNR38105.1 hypothetical protein PHYPA_021216 [Physcomitrium patens]|eukprot:XP_024398540.1 transcription termination factor MTEF1, chloroplastic-like [Physcomitrella patens]
MWMQLNSMPHSALYLNQVAIVPGVCKVESKTLVPNQSPPPTATSSRKQLHLRKASRGADKVSIRISCSPRGSSVIDAETEADTSSWRLEGATWQRVKGPTAEGGPPASVVSSKEVLIRDFDDNVVDTGAVERSSGASSDEFPTSCSDEDASSLTSARHTRERRKQRNVYSRPDMIRWRLYVEGVRTPIKEESGLIKPRRVSQQLQDVILFLESLSLDSSKLLAEYPLLSNCSIENVREVVRFFESYNLRRKHIVRLLNNNPRLLGYSVEETFMPVVRFLLTDVGLREKDVGKVVNRCARLLTLSVDERLRPTMRFLQSLGFTHMSSVVANNATLLASSVENRLIPKMEYLEGIGLSRGEAVEALIRFPAIFNYSIDTNLGPKWKYLVEEMARGLDDLKEFPQYFGYSLEYRIRPRYEFLKERGISLPLADLLKPTDEVFYARFQPVIMQELGTNV